jgi:hypothetical protein
MRCRREWIRDPAAALDVARRGVEKKLFLLLLLFLGLHGSCLHPDAFFVVALKNANKLCGRVSKQQQQQWENWLLDLFPRRLLPRRLSSQTN